MLMGIILEEKVQQYALALGLFAELKRDPVFKLEATYHLATTARNLGLYSEFKTDMASLIESGKEPWAQMALNNLVKFSGPGDSDIVAVLDNQLKAMKTPPQASDQFRINQARYYIDTGELSEASDALKLINDQSKVFAESLFLRSLIEYRSNKIEQAINLQKQALDLLWLNSKDSELRSVSALTLARMYFQIGKYKETFEAFLKVDKKHPEWLQAMIEQAWSQVLAQDYEGAAGNMFSLHTEFLKKQFTPESYVVRTVAYLNLCQFGDGAMVVKELQRKYAPFFEQIKKYKESKATPEGYYDTVRAWAKDPMQPIVNGIPGQLVYAMTKHPGFLTHQNAINALEDEATTINQISLNLVKNERALIKKISDTKLVLADAKAGSPEINRLKTNLGSYQAQFQISKTARQNIKPVREELLARVDILKAKNKKKAGMALQTNFNRIFTTLQNTLDQIDVLRYELYSGAGEHIRYQLAGGDVNDKQRPELKVEDSKALNWEFKGEVWEDEIGHYRSSLKNVCPPEEGGSQPGQ
jgi:tetratricopeptide (TPR) repeat protein